MTVVNYGGSTAAEVQAILSNVPVSTKNAIIQALQANGLLKGHRHLGVVSEINPGPYTHIGPSDRLVLLSPGSNTQISSAKPVVIGADTGSNFIDVSTKNPANAKADTIVGGSGRDTIVGNTAADSLVAGSGQELITSGGGKDTIRGGSGHDTLDGGGQSMIYAGSGPTTINAGIAVNYNGPIHDTIQAGTGKDSITLSNGNNTVYAPTAGGQATINAGAGKDTIYGPTAFQGAETINSGGKTQLNLDSGAVTYNLKNNSNDTVFGGQGSGFVNLNQTNNYTTTSSNVGGQSAVTLHFSNGAQITAVGPVNFTFKQS